jgi:CHASE3 domain sensor protein
MNTYEWICLAVICSVVGLAALVILNALDNLLDTLIFKFNSLHCKLFLLDDIDRETTGLRDYMLANQPQDLSECQELNDSVTDTIDKFLKSTPNGDSKYLEGYRDGVAWVKSLLQKEETE